MLLCQNRPARFVCLPCSFLPTTNVCQTLASSVLFQLPWQPADAIVWHREVKRKRRENGEYKRPDNLFTDWVSIDLHEAVIRATISGLMASLKVYSMNWESSIPWPQQNTISLPCQCSVHEIWPNIVISPLLSSAFPCLRFHHCSWAHFEIAFSNAFKKHKENGFILSELCYCSPSFSVNAFYLKENCPLFISSTFSDLGSADAFCQAFLLPVKNQGISLASFMPQDNTIQGYHSKGQRGQGGKSCCC